MPIKCIICNAEFEKIISSTHLKNHNITSASYKTLYGDKSLASDEYRLSRSTSSTGENNPNYGNKMSAEAKLSISSKNTGNIAWNKDTKVDDNTPYIEGARRREARYVTGELSRYTPVHSSENKAAISRGVIAYAKSHPEEMHIRGLKSLDTKRNNNYNFAHNSGMKHTQTTKDLISVKSKSSSIIKSEEAHARVLDRIALANLTLSEESAGWLHLKCNVCQNEFSHTLQMFHSSKFTTDRCNVCYPPLTNRSKKENEVFEYVKSLCPDATPNYRYSTSKKELDIYIPSLNLGIEFNGLYWHSQTILEHNGRNKTADFEKYKQVTELGIRYIMIFEDEWENKKEIVKSRLLYILQKSTKHIYARKCTVQEISSSTASKFCKEYHIQGSGRSNARMGLFYEDELVAVMTFSKNNLSRKINEWELNRFCTVSNMSIVGGASKLFKAFIREYNPPSVMTYADRRWSEGNLYKALDFKFDSFSPPGYWYICPNEIIRHHRFGLRKNKMDDTNLTEWQNRQAQGWDRIWDCGNSKWKWTR